jgi:uncharacterized protein YukE
VSELMMPGGNPDLLEQLAARLEAAASRSADLGISTRQVTASIRSGASWTGDAADAYTVFTGNLSQGAAATEAPLSRIASAVRDYAVHLRTAQQKVAAYASAAETGQVSGNDSAYVSAANLAGQGAAAAISAQQAAGDRAAAEIRTAAGELENLFGAHGPVQGWLDRQPLQWGSLAGLPGLGDPVRPQILKTPPGWQGPLVLKDPILQPGPEILLTPPGWQGPLVLKDPILQPRLGILKTPQGPQGPLINYSEQGSVPRLDGTGKVHGELPGYVPGDWTTEELEQLESDLERSIQTRQNEQAIKGEDPAHRVRISQELQLLRQVQRRLSGS